VRVLRELWRCFIVVESKHSGRAKMSELDPNEADYARFRAVASLACLIDVVRNVDRKISAIRKDVVERTKRTRKLIAKVAA
jgi:hypothetical protein